MIAWSAAPTKWGGVTPPEDGTKPGSARDVQMKTVHRKGGASRPPTGRNPPATTRMPATLIAEVEVWATTNDANRSDAIRRLLRLARSSALAALSPRLSITLAANSLARVAFSRVGFTLAVSPSSTSRLLKGPEEFREARVDRPKAKK